MAINYVRRLGLYSRKEIGAGKMLFALKAKIKYNSSVKEMAGLFNNWEYIALQSCVS